MNAPRPYGTGTTLLLLVIIAPLLLATPAGAKDILFLAGTEGVGGTTGYYNFVGAVAPLLNTNFGNGLVQKYKVDVLGYDYPANGRDITATEVGVEGALGYQQSGEKGWEGAYAGVRYSQTWLSPDDPGSRVRGSQLRPTLQLEGERALLNDLKVNGLGSYIFISDSYWSKWRVMYRVHDKIYTGPEFTAQGDPSCRAWGSGWFVTGFQPFANSSLGLKAGVRKVEQNGTGGYFGIEFSRMF
jgi:hypothetical protein